MLESLPNKHSSCPFSRISQLQQCPSHPPPGQPGAFAHVASPGGGAFAYPERPPVFAIRVSESAMEEFIGKDEAFVEDWLVRQGLDKLVDIFKGTISQFKILLDYL